MKKLCRNSNLMNSVILSPKSQYQTLKTQAVNINNSRLVTRITCTPRRRLSMRRYVCPLSRAALKFLNESAGKMAETRSHSWFLASGLFLWPACGASVRSVDAHMCHDVQGINIYSKQRERKPPYHARRNESLIHKHKLSMHIHIPPRRLSRHVLIRLQVRSSGIRGRHAICAAAANIPTL